MARSIGKEESTFYRSITHLHDYDDYHGPYTTIGAAKGQARNLRWHNRAQAYTATIQVLVPLINDADELTLGWKDVAKYDGTNWTNI